jgi:ABC-type multidrug transport system fused ATPase/permease subunit
MTAANESVLSSATAQPDSDAVVIVTVAFGFVLIIATFVVVWRGLALQHHNRGLLVTFGGMLLFVGLACIFSDTVSEITTSFGSIKRAKQNATKDAQEIANIKTRIEEIEKRASQSLSDLERVSQFTSQVVAAQNGNRKAFDQLEAWANDQKYPFHDRAAEVWSNLLEEHSPKGIGVEYYMEWQQGPEASKLTLPELIERYRTEAQPEMKMAVLQHLGRRQDIPKADRLAFLASVLEAEQSLRILEIAGEEFTTIADLQIKPLAIRQLLRWWGENRNTIR